MPYGGNFSAVGGFLFFGGNGFGGGDKTKIGGNFSAVSGFSIFGGNVNGGSILGGNCGA